MWLAGLLWGIACLFKYQAGINLFVMAAYLLIARPILVDRRIRWREFLSFFAGGAIIGALFAIYLVSIGVWDDFVSWSIAGSGAYISTGAKLINFWKSLGVRGGLFIASSLALWILAIIGAVRLFKRHGTDKHTPEQYLILIWFLLSIIAICTGGKFYGHYFIQLLPPMCIIAGGVAARLRRMLPVVIIAGLLIPAAGFFAARLYSDRIYAALGEENPDRYRPIAEYVKGRTADDDTIFVWGFATPVYFFAGRLGASRFLWCDWLTGRAPGTPQAKDPDFDTTAFIAEGSWEIFFADMERNRPAYFVDTSPGDHHDYGKYPVRKFLELKEFLRKNYRLEESIEGADIYRRVR